MCYQQTSNRPLSTENNDFWKHITWLRVLLAILGIAITSLLYYFAPILISDSTFQSLIRDVTAASIGTLLGVIATLAVLRNYTETSRLRQDLVAETNLLREELVNNLRSILEHGTEVIPNPVISQVLEEARSDGGTYTFIGNTGSHFTSVTLSDLAARAKDGYKIEVNAQILDPRSEKACRDLARVKGHNNWEKIQAELLATLVICWFYSYRVHHLKFSKVSLRPFFTHMRIDFGAPVAVATTEPKEHPAVVFRAQRHFHTQLRTMVEALVDATDSNQIITDIEFDTDPNVHSLSDIDTNLIDSLILKMGPN